MQNLLHGHRLGAALLERVPQFVERRELAGGVGEISWLLGGGHRADEQGGVGDAVLDFGHHGDKGRRRLLAGEGEGTLGFVVVVGPVEIGRDGFGFGEHKSLASMHHALKLPDGGYDVRAAFGADHAELEILAVDFADTKRLGTDATLGRIVATAARTQAAGR